MLRSLFLIPLLFACGCASTSQKPSAVALSQWFEQVAAQLPTRGPKEEGTFPLPIFGDGVKLPGVYYVRRSVTVSEAIDRAGGTTKTFWILGSHIAHKGQPEAIRGFGHDEKAFFAAKLVDGDILYVAVESL